MSRCCRFSLNSLAATLLLALAATLPAWAQHGSTGKVTVSVVDQSGAVVQGAQLELRDLSTNDVRKAATQNSGAYTFVDLPIGTYKLTVSQTGYETQAFASVVVQAARVTDVRSVLKVGVQQQVVEVEATATPVLETTTNAIGSTIDLKQIEDLPISGRDLTQLSQLVPGFSGCPTCAPGVQGTWVGLPSIAQGSNIDGVIGSPSRMKFGGNAQPVVSARLEDIQEMTVQTDQLDLNQGYGQADMQVNFVTRRGTNSFHGRVYEDFQNAALNSNSWFNNAAGLKKNPLILNDFGGAIGGPILKNKLFFFGALGISKQPGSINANNLVLTPAAQNGAFTYVGTDNALHTVNVLGIAKNFGGLPSSVNPMIASELQGINGATQYGAVSPYSDPNMENLSWLQPSPTTIYYPSVRVDYNASQSMRFNFAFNESRSVQPSVSPSFLPGPSFANQAAGNRYTNYTAAFGFDWTISPTLINQFKGGFLYNWSGYAYNAAPLYFGGAPAVNWNLPVPYPFGGNMSGAQFNLPVSTYYPVFNISDTMTWQHHAHTFSYGFSWYREQDHYWNPPAGFPNYTLGTSTGLVAGDPAIQAFTTTGSGATLPAASSAQQAEAEDLYAVLTGRISSVGGQFPYDSSTGQYNHNVGAYNLDELQKAWGLFFQDSYKVKPTLTLNYGLRWDFTGDDYDLTGAYHGGTPNAVFGPSGINNLFNPGVFQGDVNPMLTARSHQYNPWNVSPQPSFGFAWNPQFTEGLLGKLTGGGNTVIRGGFSLRDFTEPYQYFWNNASDYGAFFYQNFYLNSNTTGQTGTFAPGSLSLGNTLPAYGFAPQSYQASAPESAYTFLNSVGVYGIDPHIKQPYTESWNLGIQRGLGNTRAFEIRYVGSRTVHQWVNFNVNEVNIFENGFLNQFKAAQKNLAINQAHGVSSFADNGYPGQQQTPVFNAAFAGEGSGGTGVPLADYANSNFITDLTTGQAGAMASALSGIAGTVPYFCNLVGASFSPCATNAGYTGAGAGYPINFFQANPYNAGNDANLPIGVGYTAAAGYSNYNGLQFIFRQKTWHGMQFDANYTWSHTLGISTPNQWTGAFTQFSLRDLRRSYGPTLFDMRNVLHVNATYDLPFGLGKTFLNHRGVIDKVVGGWTVGTIFTFESGEPFQLQGGNMTYNDYADGGVMLNGVTPSQLQNSVGVYRVSPAQNGGSVAPYVDLVNPQYLASPAGGGANTAYIQPNTVAGTIGQTPWLYGPHQTFDDMAISKRFPIHESLNFTFQAELLNAFNHPVFGQGSYPFYAPSGYPFSPNVQSQSFGIGGVINQPRAIELRANIEF